jgi:hypothetical protein
MQRLAALRTGSWIQWHKAGAEARKMAATLHIHVA